MYWLVNNINSHLVINFAIRKCTAIITDNLQICINKIITYIWDKNKNINIIPLQFNNSIYINTNTNNI